jgi:uncharacterized protein YcbX
MSARVGFKWFHPSRFSLFAPPRFAARAMLMALQLPSPSYLAAPLQPPRTCAAPPQPRVGAASLARPPMCARRTTTLFALSPEPSPSAEVHKTPANASAKVLELAALLTYPIKSVRAVGVPTARLGPEGLEGDRRLLVASAANLAITQRQHPRLATVTASLEGSWLSLRAPGQPPLNVTLPLETGAPVTASLFGSPVQLFDQGREAGRWLTALLDAGRPSLLPLLGMNAYKLLAAPARTRRTGGLSDLAPLLVMCEESVADLNARRALRGQPPVGIDRFRPNIVLRGCAPLEEDTWCGLTIGGAAAVRISSPCPRCTVPDVDQLTGAADSPAAGPMTTLRGYRARAGRGVLFGAYASVLTPGATIRVGAPVQVQYC